LKNITLLLALSNRCIYIELFFSFIQEEDKYALLKYFNR
jgi:hypothetical protein